MLTEPADTVVGVDTHAERHAFCFVDARSGLVLDRWELPATRAGYREALRRARRGGLGHRVWALEGSGCYGAGLRRLLERRGERVLEVERPKRRGRDGRLKSDLLDAERAARAVLAADKLAIPRRGAEREALRVLLVVREQEIGVRRGGLNELRALLVTAPAELGLSDSLCRQGLT